VETESVELTLSYRSAKRQAEDCLAVVHGRASLPVHMITSQLLEGSAAVSVPVRTTTFGQFTAALPTPLLPLVVKLSESLSRHDEDEASASTSTTRMARRLRGMLGRFTAAVKSNDAWPPATATRNEDTSTSGTLASAAEAGSEVVTIGELSLSIAWNISFLAPCYMSS
jgi:hypothetical protein